MSRVITAEAGVPSANAGIEAFEQKTNFRYTLDPGRPNASRIVNLTPLAGEQASYPREMSAQGYSLVSRVPRPGGEGTILIFSGTDMGSVEAGCNLLASEHRLNELFDRLGVKPAGQIPYFEVLLRTKLLGAAVHSSYEIVAYRLIKN